mgnify:CR=1 FL=1
MRQVTFQMHGITDPEAWDLELAEWMACIQDYDGKAVARVEDCGGYYDVHFPDGHYILGVSGYHLSPQLP